MRSPRRLQFSRGNGSAAGRDHEASDPAPCQRTGSSMSSGATEATKVAAGNGPISFDSRERVSGLAGFESAPACQQEAVSSASTAEMRSRGRRPARSGGRSVRCVATRSTVIRPRTEDFLSPAATGDERRTRWTTRRRRARVPATWSRRCRPSTKVRADEEEVERQRRRHVATAAALGPRGRCGPITQTSATTAKPVA